MSKMLATNKTLKYLNLWRCNIGSEGGQLILHGINRNDTILFFEFGNNGLSQTHQIKISERLDQNKTKNQEEEELRQHQEQKQADEDTIIKAEIDQKTKEVLSKSGKF